MLDLRTVTLGVPFDVDRAKAMRLKERIAARLTPRTFRINLPPLDIRNQERAYGILETMGDLCTEMGIRWFNTPFDLTKENPHLSEFVLTLMRRYNKSFINLIIAKNNQINYQGIKQACAITKKISQMGDQGFHNFRVGVSCNPAANTPFFPFSYSDDMLGFSVALELPKLMAEVIAQHKDSSISEIQESLLNVIGPQLQELDALCCAFEEELGARYHGIDLSIAPFPEDESSMAGLLETLGVEVFGAHGSLFFTSFFTDILKELKRRTQIRTTGFNGVMYSLLEDTILSRANNRNMLSLDALISYSSVCGCGLDMVPVPGDTFQEELASIVLDVAGLSSTLNKPLGVRLLPIPGMKAGEMTTFNMDFLSNSRIMAVKHRVTWSDHLQKEPFSYKNKQPLLDNSQVKNFWFKKGDSTYKEVNVEDLKPLWYVYQESDQDFLNSKLAIEHEVFMGALDLDKKMEVLDLGSGNGYWTFQIAPRVHQVDGVDYCANLVAQSTGTAGRNKIENVSFQESPAQDFSSEKKYDVIIISGVLIYMNDTDVDKLTANMSRYSKPGTRLILREGTGIDGRHTVDNAYSEALKAQYSAVYRTSDEYIKRFEAIGFKSLRDTNFFPEGHPLNKFPETRLRLYVFEKDA